MEHLMSVSSIQVILFYLSSDFFLRSYIELFLKVMVPFHNAKFFKHTTIFAIFNHTKLLSFALRNFKTYKIQKLALNYDSI